MILMDPAIQNSVEYYQNILRELRKGIDSEIKEEHIATVLQESLGKEIHLSSHNLVSHCLELLLAQCDDILTIQRFMAAFEDSKIPAYSNGNASHITELLIHHAIKNVQKDFAAIFSEEIKDKPFGAYCINWIEQFGNFALENLEDCLSLQYSCHVLCTLIRALAGDFAVNREFMSKNLRIHKREFQSQFSDIKSPIKEHKPVILEQIPKCFSDLLKKLYKSIIQSEHLIYYINDSSSATVIEALIFALKKRLPKSCKKMISKIAKNMFSEKNKDSIPPSLLHKTASFVFDEMFKAADEDVQLELWSQYISNHISELVKHPVGNFVVQRIYDAVKSRSLLETVCKETWCLFDEIVKAKNFGIFVSISSACIRLSVQQSFFMENIMQCLQCFEPVERQGLVVPLLLGFQKYENYTTRKNSENNLKVCLQGSLVVQAILKYQKPVKAVMSILNMSPEDLEYLAGHTQGCHVLNAFFGSLTVGNKNKEMLLLHMKPVLVNIACDRNKSLTLSRIWTCLPLKMKEIVARHLAHHKNTLKEYKSGHAIFMKFGIARLRRIEEWRTTQSNICHKKPKH